MKKLSDQTMDFSKALSELKKGKKIQRNGWNGKGMYLILKQSYPVNGHLNAGDPNKILEPYPDGSDNIPKTEGGQMLSFIVMKTAGCSRYWGEPFSDFVPWLASQTDILAEDWQKVE